MNTFIDDLYNLEYFSDPSNYLTRWIRKAFECLDNYVDNSLVLNVTTLQKDTLNKIESLDLPQYKYIFILDVMDPPHYNFHLQSLRTIFNKHLHKTFYVSCAHNNQFFKTIYFNIFLAFGPEEIIEPVISRKFLKKYVSFNHNPHYHRLLLIKTLYDNDLLNEGYVSGYLYDNNKFVFSSENYPEELLDKNFLNLFPIICEEDSLNVDADNFNEYLHNEFLKVPNPYYSCPVSLLTETSINGNSIFITEKTLKSLICKQLIMLVGSPRTYEFLTKVYGLRNYGFDFEHKISHLNTEDRIAYYCSFLKETTLNDLSSIYKDKEDILEHNKNKVLTEFKQISYNLFLTSLKKHRIINL